MRFREEKAFTFSRGAVTMVRMEMKCLSSLAFSPSPSLFSLHSHSTTFCCLVDGEKETDSLKYTRPLSLSTELATYFREIGHFPLFPLLSIWGKSR